MIWQIELIILAIVIVCGISALAVKDLLSALADESFKPDSETLKKLLRKPWFIPGRKPVDELLRAFG